MFKDPKEYAQKLVDGGWNLNDLEKIMEGLNEYRWIPVTYKKQALAEFARLAVASEG